PPPRRLARPLPPLGRTGSGTRLNPRPDRSAPETGKAARPAGRSGPADMRNNARTGRHTASGASRTGRLTSSPPQFGHR
ncbi:hypothetical protein, partial [Gluconacetobacter sp.]|uniref:hypothetical protein n=1 Tax=Gluconacetobacter sp. TaxID=1935994 RepID=UPI0039EAEFDA